MKLLKRISPALALFLLAPTIGELLSGSAPPAEFFNPISFTFLAILYGGGAILIRELTLRWDKGWPTIITLGAAYGIIEEGLMVKSFFDPNWMDLDLLGSYGRWEGVNWVWSLELTIYHAIFSIAIPILLASLIFSDRQHEPWVSRRAFHWLILLFVLNGIFINLALTTYRPPLLHYLITIGLVFGLIALARRLPKSYPPINETQPSRAHRFVLLGFLSTLVFFVLNWVLPHTQIPPLATMILVLLLLVLIRWRVRKYSNQGFDQLNGFHLALASGALSFFILIAPIQEFDQSRIDDTSGMTLVGLAAFLFQFWLGIRLRKEDSQNQAISQTKSQETPFEINKGVN